MTGGKKNHSLDFGGESHVRHLTCHVQKTARYTSLEFRVGWAGDKNEGVQSTEGLGTGQAGWSERTQKTEVPRGQNQEADAAEETGRSAGEKGASRRSAGPWKSGESFREEGVAAVSLTAQGPSDV